MIDSARANFLATIRTNIERCGHHVTIVAGGPSPRFGYTIGASDGKGPEYIFAGGSYFSSQQVKEALDAAIATGARPEDEPHVVKLRNGERFSLRAVDKSWTHLLALGALDYFGVDEIQLLQLLPTRPRMTVDVPDLGRPFAPDTEPAWRWRTEAWSYPIPKRSVAGTHLAVLQGVGATEVTRWEEDEWEIFAGSGEAVEESAFRRVPLGVLLAADPSLEPIVNLQVGDGLHRESPSDPWVAWE